MRLFKLCVLFFDLLLEFSVLEIMLLTEVRGDFKTVENDSKYPLKKIDNFFYLKKVKLHKLVKAVHVYYIFQK